MPTLMRLNASEVTVKVAGSFYVIWKSDSLKTRPECCRRGRLQRGRSGRGITIARHWPDERYFLSIAHQTDSLLVGPQFQQLCLFAVLNDSIPEVQGLAESCNIQEHATDSIL